MAKTAPTPETAPDRPTEGGSYVVRDGKLHRKEGPEASGDPALPSPPQEPVEGQSKPAEPNS
ncbi:hypothetical protein [Methylopila sp. M107]|uniref:hypothetical protein n=1 Tax=Methylopila sp. M107 TaxID=1101190 RepID=UPI0003774C25|nr:hypothetical protein [Methylopila sp. M107]